MSHLGLEALVGQALACLSLARGDIPGVASSTLRRSIGNAPGRILVKRRHLACKRGSLLAKILLIDNAVLRDDEGHHTSRPIPLRVRDQGESASRLSPGSPAASQYAEIVTLGQHRGAVSGFTTGHSGD